MLRFFDSYIAKSPEANFCIRYNRGVFGPFTGKKWNLDKRSVVEDSPHVYTSNERGASGISAFSKFEDNYFYREEFGIFEKNKEEERKILLLDYDQEAVITGPPFYELLDFVKNRHEICLAYANIVAVYTEEEFELASETGELYETMETFMKIKRLIYGKYLYIKRPWFWETPPVQRVDGVNQQDMRHYLMDAAQTLPVFKSEIHGIYHWKWVASMATHIYFFHPQTDLLVCMWFAVLHDSQRKSDGEDEGHGQRAAEYIDHIRGVYLTDLTDEQISKLKKACYTHTSALQEDDPTVATCIDSDRLHLWRVGIKPSPERLLTQRGKEIAKLPYKEWPFFVPE